MENIIYTAAPRSRGRYRIFKRYWKQYRYGGQRWVHENTDILTKHPKAVIFALIKKDESEMKIKKNA